MVRGAGAARVNRRDHGAQHGRRHAKPVRFVTVGADGPSPIRMPLVVEGHDGGIRDEGGRALLLDPARVAWEDETVLARGPGVFEAAVVNRASKLAGRDQ